MHSGGMFASCVKGGSGSDKTAYAWAEPHRMRDCQSFGNSLVTPSHSISCMHYFFATKSAHSEKVSVHSRLPRTFF